MLERGISFILFSFLFSYFFCIALASGEAGTSAPSPWICPIAMLEVGQYPFVLVKPCGCVISARALKEIKAPNAAAGAAASGTSAASLPPSSTSAASALETSNTPTATSHCLVCAAPLPTGSGDLIALNPDDDELATVRKALRAVAAEAAAKKKAEKDLKKKLKKEKKQKHKASDDGGGESKKRKTESKENSSAKNNGAPKAATEGHAAFSSKSSGIFFYILFFGINILHFNIFFLIISHDMIQVYNSIFTKPERVSAEDGFKRITKQ